ncbi:MAG: GlsB/YeaQ/YmgE family stress response membrane protein, partial [Verrucomicrobiales bacterium]
MEILYTIIIGLVVGVIAKLLMPGKDPGGFIITTLIGIAGAMLAKLIGQAMGWYTAGESAGFIAAVVGAIILLILYR